MMFRNMNIVELIDVVGDDLVIETHFVVVVVGEMILKKYYCCSS